MLIIGCDFHTRYQQIAMANDETTCPFTRFGAFRYPPERRVQSRPGRVPGGEAFG
jgi:hypothetical protein